MFVTRGTSAFVVSVGYVGTKTVHQLLDFEQNWAPPGGGTEGRQYYPISTTSITYWNGQGDSNYHSLQIALNRRFTNGWWISATTAYNVGGISAFRSSALSIVTRSGSS